MSARLEELSRRRQILQLQCAMQRVEFALAAEEARHGIAWVDGKIASVRSALTNPLLMGGGIAALATFGPKRLLRWASRLTILLPLIKRFIFKSH